jgi:hypothetical protein
MSDYDVGYAKPPKHAQFKKGVCPNPHGRGKRRDLKVAEILDRISRTWQTEEGVPNRIEHQKVCRIGDQG